MYKRPGRAPVEVTLAPTRPDMAAARSPALPLLLLVALFPAARCMPIDNALDDEVLFSKLQACFTASGMAQLDSPLEQLADKLPSLSRRRDILQGFLDCCSKQDFPGMETLEANKQDSEELSQQLKVLQQKIQTIYKNYLMGTSVGLSMLGS
ncbi:uncharacterized protein LOC119107695 [Pollicipes pollicipes]|uniref:uncharacterized protein LOC119107695 n=1 Tax=Pollicipes pollicipes TaxID=41117 RepID=UPI0018858F61|nr:uncharacterized protein LOC119107695 [Pollicipes pollicipes]